MGTLPIPLFGDELDVGYHALSLFHSLRDYTGHFLPTYIQSLAEWRTPLLMYITAPFVGLLGTTAFAVRLPVALLGILNVYQVYLLANLLFPKTVILKLRTINYELKTGTIAALILALTPWHLHYSRAAFESTLLLTLLLWGVIWYLHSLQSFRFPYRLFPIPFILTLYTYSTATVFTPLLLLALLIIYRPVKWRPFIFNLVFFTPFLIPFLYYFFTGAAGNRFQGISIFTDNHLIDQIITTRTEPWVTNNLFETFFHNKYLAYSVAFLRNYFSSFSPQFLFLYSDTYFRHSIGNFGALLWSTAPFFLVGLYALFHDFKNPTHRFIFAWTLLAPIPAALTQGGATHATRLFVLVLPLILITALGAHYCFKLLHHRLKVIILPLFLLATALNFSAYWHNYSAHYRFLSATYWNYGFDDIFTKLIPYQKSAHKIYINDTYQPAIIAFAFYTAFPPEIFQKHTDNLKTETDADFFGYQFTENLYFGQIKDGLAISDLLSKNDLYLAVQQKEIPGDWNWNQNPPPGIKVLATTNDQFGRPLFYLLTRSDNDFSQ